MRIQSGLPKQFWAEAVNTAAYLINRGPSKPLDLAIPEEIWTGKEVKLYHLKVFGCVSYVHVSDHARSKLDAKSVKCTLVGYGEDEFGYKLWDDQNRKMIRSRDVVFNEKVMYKDRNTETSEKKEPDYFGPDDVSGGEIVERGSNQEVEEQDAREPECYDEACQGEDANKWELAMNDEMKSLVSNQTWELAKLPEGKKALQNKWVFRIKEEHDGSKRYKARLVVKGFQQKEGIDYTDIFSPVVKLTTIRLVLSIVAAKGLYLEQLDVKTAFLHGDLEEEIYMQQPEGFAEKGNEEMVCRLTKSLYGLKQAPRQWYKKFDGFMQKNGYFRCNADHCCYFKKVKSSFIILLLYVDDMLVAGANLEEINNLKKQLSSEFEMKDLGAAKQILGMRISRDEQGGTLQLSQAEYIRKVLQRFNMSDAKPVKTPLASHFRLSKEQCPETDEEKDFMARVPYASAIGSLMYAMVCTRPDISHAVGVMSRYMSNPGKQHWEAVKWILRYLRGTTEKCLTFRKDELKLEGYVDSDFAGEVDHRRSTTGYVFTLGSTAISWVSQLQKIVTISTTEAEYVAVTEASKKLIWLQGLLAELGFEQEMNVLHSDSQSAIHLAKNSAFHSRTKHIDLRYHFIRSLIEDGVLKLVKIVGSKNPADMLTKPVTTEKLELCAASVGLQGPLHWPVFVVAVLAAIIASQALISGAFSVIQQSLAFGCFPRVRVVHTSAECEGQVYIPEINYLLMLACIGVTLGFKTTEKMGNAYGIAVVFVMILASFLMFENKISPERLKEIAADTSRLCRIPGLSIFYSELVDCIPPVFKNYVANVPALHSVLVFVSTESLPISKVPFEERFIFRRLVPMELNIFLCVARFGYADIHNKEEPFELVFVDKLKAFIRESYTSQMTITGREGIIEIEEESTEELMDMVGDTIEEENHEENCEDLMNRDIEMLEKAFQGGVVHVIGDTEVVAAQGAGIGMRVMINYVYDFLKRNSRQDDEVFNHIIIPHKRILKVGIIYEL
ncbi:hypothetical protein LWI29_010645 [Acer saccharum]|uniref:Uncharacterized protein n=1 Tax=Acer saccharum TaxID=4024 RepID=A0AA39RGV6_ACESA|nr:hypothetical protein LWI29_010645 [Acer saccharum]